MLFAFHAVVTVSFAQSSFTVEEDSTIIQPLLTLSNPSSFIETIQVISTNISATGTYICILQ